MTLLDKIISIVIALALSVTILPIHSIVASPGPRADALDLPQWNVGDFWEYRNDVTYVAPRGIFRLLYQDSQTPGGPYDVTAEMQLTPATQATQTKFTVVDSNVGTSEIKINKNNWTWDNGSWATMVVDTGGDPGVNIGETVQYGDYVITDSCIGEMYMDLHNLNLKRGTYNCDHKIDATGMLVWTEDLSSNIVESTTNGIEAVLKPDWETKPLQVGDSWAQSNDRSIVTDSVYSFGGDIAGNGVLTTTVKYYWDFDWAVTSMNLRTIVLTKYGNTNFTNSAKVERSGGFDWDYNDGSTSSSGHVNSASSQYWYACHGVDFDAGWFIEVNYATRIINSNHKCFRNSAPIFTAPPPGIVDIRCDEQWVFKKGVDYDVVDPDPGDAGRLSFSIRKVLGTDANVLQGLTIDPDTGDIEFTPLQHDVADGYTLTIKVTDNYDKGPLGNEASFILNIRNKNHAPTVNITLPGPLLINEGERYIPSWNLSTLIHDIDLDPNPLMANQPYDPNEQVAYSIDGLGALSVQCPDGKEFGPQHQCIDIRFAAIDGKFPKDVPLKVNFTATDSFSSSAWTTISITIKHINHQPTLVNSCPTELFTDVNVPINLDLQNYFHDSDVNNPFYLTGDALVFQSRSSLELSIQVSGLYAKILPKVDWCGRGNASFRATDKSGAYAEGKSLNITVQNCGPQFDLISWSPMTDMTLQEAGTSNTIYRGQIVLSIKLNEKRGPLTYIWTVQDLSDGRTYFPATNSSGFLFKTNYDEDFYHGVFFGNDVSRIYHVSVNISDGKIQVPVMSWNLTVKNTDRAPKISGVALYKVLENGALVRVPNSPIFSYDLEIGGLYLLDVSHYISDEDEGIGNGQGLQNLSRLDINWLSNEDGIDRSGPVLKIGAARTQAGYVHLQSGTAYLLSVNVTDSEGAYSQLMVSLKVNTPEKAYTQKTDYSYLVTVVIILAVVIAVVYRIRKSL
jgi:hypothetical protein